MRLVINSDRINDPTESFQKLKYAQYLKLRLQFWKWKLHRMHFGRPVLKLRHKPRQDITE